METQQPVDSYLTGSPAPTEDERNAALLAHIGGIILPILVPLFIMQGKGEKSAWVKAQAVEALNFQITVFIGYVLSGVLTAVCIGALLLPLVMLAAIVLGIMAGMKTQKGESYRYPATLRLVK
ncbi:DUF4870 domain-containing protein [Myxococcus sp. RHSTA-1-4]|uniref:DUF4870 domain-containing protein n=1 Tax=Myxococcus sp. RHSTA-1-4 TaxID=2874601 RepID=UPI001CBFD6A8|nr:DUF4870 domain-containing protein [Myxococcus sp. RHSTA-1-4]MBZ4420896.1 DUF4870 domain-containing protein [Myxococcus sp. RHSTA-1-4]